MEGFQASAAAGPPCDRNIDTTPTAARPHMPGPGPAGVKNVKHAFTLCCEEKSQDALLSLGGQDDGVTAHVCHMAHAGDLFMSCCM